MPIYSYQCSECDHDFSQMILIAERDIPESSPCPNCGALRVRRYLDTPPRLVSGVNLASKVPHGFRDVLKKIKKAHPLGRIDGEMS